jgi:hypothetical protein
MNPVLNRCPSEEQLQAILRGQASARMAESFAEHLETCERCGTVAEQSLASPPLLEAIRSHVPPEGSTPGYVLALMEKLERLPPRRKLEETSAGNSAGESSEATVVRPPFDFLAPPQGPGELGRLGDYRVLKVLGKGGMGVVFQAEDVRLKRMVALKVIRPEAAGKPSTRERFFREAQAAAALEHENIVTVYQVGEDAGVPFLAMQWLKGMSLEERLRQGGALTVPQIVRLGKQIALGLAAAHAAGLIHRDVKPANLWLEPVGGGRIKILDFGLARVGTAEAGLTQSGDLIGTPSYMAPEQARGGKVGPESDLFSLGVVLYRLCTGGLPFKGDNPMTGLSSLALDEPSAVGQVNPAVPAALAELVMHLLSKDPSKRPSTAQEVADRLEAIRGQVAAGDAPAPTVEPDRAVRRPSRWAAIGKPSRLAGAAAVLALLLGGLGWQFGGTVVRFATDRGQVVIETDDPAIDVKIKDQAGTIVDGGTKRTYTVAAGAEHELEVTVKDEGGSVLKLATRRFRVSRGGRAVLRVEMLPARAEVKKPSPDRPGVAVVPARGDDRKAALWVLSIGGALRARVGEKEEVIRAAENLPKGDFQLVGIDLLRATRVRDAGLAHLEGLTNLSYLELGAARVRDAGLAHLKGLTKLSYLSLGGTQVNDAGLAHLKGLANLTLLGLQHVPVSDAGLAHLKGLTKLSRLDLDGTRVSDAGLAHLKDLTKLTDLNLANTPVSDAGLAHLKSLTNLAHLNLGPTRVSDAGLAHLKGLTNLTQLSLNNTRVSDAGLAHLKGLANLTTLLLEGTRVSDAGLAHLKGLANLTHFNLSATQVSDAGLAHLKGLTKLSNLHLQGAQVSDAGLAHLKDLSNLTSLNLDGTRVSDAGLAHLKGLTNLTNLGMVRTRVSDAGLK